MKWLRKRAHESPPMAPPTMAMRKGLEAPLPLPLVDLVVSDMFASLVGALFILHRKYYCGL